MQSEEEMYYSLLKCVYMWAFRDVHQERRSECSTCSSFCMQEGK